MFCRLMMWFQLLKCKYWLVFLIFYDVKIHTFGFRLLFGQKKKFECVNLGLLEIVMDAFHYFVTFYDR